ncbi:hypothetical protein I541_2418 [Mycobacteroides abscessus]|nr:hypothetical protein I541_2418 [Mycobacteroides abscessus]
MLDVQAFTSETAACELCSIILRSVRQRSDHGSGCCSTK